MSTPVYPYAQFPPQGQAQITSKGLLQNQLYYLLQALFRRTGSGSGLANTVGMVTAAGTNQATATVLSNDYNNVTSGTGGVQLANLQPSQFQQIVNNTAAVINVYPTVGGQIQGSAVNAPVTLGVGLQQTFTGYSVNAAGAAVYQSDTALQSSVTNWVVAGGSADAITAAYVPAVGSVIDGQLFFVRATAANATTTPTFSPNGLPARAITRLGGQTLFPGDIPGAFAEVILRYNLAHTRYELLNPARPDDGFWVVAGGSADAITATYAPAVIALVDGQLFFLRATAANATTTPTFSPNGLPARTITRHGGQALSANDIPGALAEVILRYNAANTRYEILNPAGVYLVVSVQSFTASGVYTPHANLLYAIVTAIGAGGGAGASTGSATGISSGGGGGGGGGARAVLSATQIGANQTVTIGAHGVGSVSAGGNGTAGTATSFGTLVVAGGGGLGHGGGANAAGAGGLGGTGTTGAIKFPGSAGSTGLSASITTVNGPSGWGGAPAFIGVMTPGVINAAGSVGACAGAGGSGGQSAANAGASNGGDGVDGFIEVIEYSFAI